jgi:hypothetical protein
MRTRLLLLLAVAGCSKKESGDDCERFVDKSKPAMEAMMKESGKTMSDADKAKLVADCREHHGKAGNKDDALLKCVLDASGDDKVKACWADAMGDFRKKSKKTEAALQLNKMSKNLKVYYVTNAAFPAGKSGPTPAAGCCGQPNAKCAVTDAWAKDKIWQELDFQIDEPNQFQYSYDSDGKTVTATAVGDLDCDTTMITYTLKMSAPDGNPKSEIVEPPPDAD